MSENNKIFDEEWQKLRDEYQQLIGNNNVELPIKDVENITIPDLNDVELNIPENIENTNEQEEFVEESKTELEELKMEKDRNIQREEIVIEDKKSESLLNKGIKKMQERIIFTLDNIEKKKHREKQQYWSEENKQDIANVIIVFIFICCLFVFCFAVTKISVGVLNILEKSKEHDIIGVEELVYVDEEERTYHFNNCSHIKENMRYLKLEEPYAIQLGYKRCDSYKNYNK